MKNIPVSPPHHSVLNPDSGEENKIPTSLISCSHVFIREDATKPPLAPLYRGPYLVLNRFPKFFLLQVGSKADSVSVDRLKPVLSEFPVVSQDPPRRGRPPNPKPPAPKPPAPAPSLVRATPYIKAKRNSNLVPRSPSSLFPLPTRRNPRRAVRNKPHPRQQGRG